MVAGILPDADALLASEAARSYAMPQHPILPLRAAPGAAQ